MAQSAAIAAFKLALSERFQQFQNDLASVINVFADRSSESDRLSAVTTLVASCRDLHDYLPSVNRPGWLLQIYNRAKNYVSNANQPAAREFLMALLKNYPSIRAIEFEDDLPLIDFDALYLRYRDAGKLSQLFEKQIEIVNKIIESGEVDSITVIEALKKIVELIQSNKNGSYLAVKSTVLTTRYLKNLCIEFLKKFAGLDLLIAAYERTADEIEGELDTIESSINDETKRAVEESLPKSRLLGFKSQLALPAPDCAGSAVAE